MLTSAATLAISWARGTERFEDPKPHDGGRTYSRVDDGHKGRGFTAIFWILLALDILIGALAAYLSWWACGLVEWNVVFKLIFSFLSFLFGWLYVIAFLLYKVDMAMFIQRSRQSRWQPPPAAANSAAANVYSRRV